MVYRAKVKALGILIVSDWCNDSKLLCIMTELQIPYDKIIRAKDYRIGIHVWERQRDNTVLCNVHVQSKEKRKDYWIQYNLSLAFFLCIEDESVTDWIVSQAVGEDINSQSKTNNHD